MNADDIFRAIQQLSDTDRRRLLDRVAHELGEPPPASARQAPAAVNRQRALGLDAGRVWIADDFDAPLPDDIQRAFEGEDDAP